MTVSRKESKKKKKLETIAIVPRCSPLLRYSSQMSFVWEEMGVGSRRHRHWGPGTKARDSVLRYIKILDSQCDENHNPNVFQVLES